MQKIQFALSFQGNAADEHELDFYDAAEALIGFQRSLALTTHLVLNGKIITQAPSLRGAGIMVRPPVAGSWTILTAISLIAAGAYKIGTAPKDTPIGNVIRSAYDYVINESMGFHVDYDSTLGQQREEHLQRARQERIDPPPLIIPTETQMDSLAEKCENAFKQMHRPIIGKETATSANITYARDGERKNIINLDSETYDYISFTEKIDIPIHEMGRVSSYNTNTYKGRIFLPSERRPIPFELDGEARSPRAIRLITESLAANAQNRFSETESGDIFITAFRHESKTSILKKLSIIDVNSVPSA